MSYQNREDFLHAAGLFEFAMLLIGLFLGWLFSVGAVEQIHWNWPAVMWASLAGVVLFLVITTIERLPFNPLKSIQDTVVEIIGRPLSQCSLLELALLASLAGIGEEVLFRGFLMSWLESFAGHWIALGLSSVAFGLVHAVTWVYTIFAAMAGLFFGWLYDATGERNLLVPIISHSLYDFLAFIMIVREAKKVYGDAPPEENSETENEFEW